MASPMSSIVNSPPGTPSRARSASPIVTPRTKVAAMIAAMDSGSSEDEYGDIDELMRKAAKPPPGIKKDTSLFNNVSSDDSDEEEGGEGEGENELVRPRGKIAARMHAAHQAQAAKKRNERVKPSIFSGDKEDSTPASRSDEEMEDDEDDIPVSASRRKITPKKKPTSPKPSSTSSTPRPVHTSATPPLTTETDSEDDLSAKIRAKPQFMALVAKKKAERREREAEEAAKEAERRKNRAHMDTQQGSNEEDSGSDNLLSQRAPTKRRAGKKALEEMHKETQRMARSMQLAHQATTRKKITKQSLFDKFNFRSSKPAEVNEKEGDSSAKTSFESEQPSVSTPSSSPGKEVKNTSEDTAMEDVELPVPTSQLEVMDLDDETTPKPDKGKGKALYISPRLDKGKGKAIDKGKGKATPTKSPKTKFTLPPVRVILPLSRPSADDSDSDLEILPDKPVPTPVTVNEAAFSERQKMIQELRQVRRASPPKARKAGLTAKELQAELLRKGRQQAVQEREEQIQELKAKGIIVLTSEEMAKEKAEVEDLLEKARQEALAIKRAEKRKEKGDRGVKGEGDDDDDDDEEDDENWLEEEDAESAIELSGSEEEEGEDGEDGEGGEGGEGGDEKPTINDFSDEEKNNSDLDDGTSTPVFSLSSMRPNATPRLSEVPAAYIDEASDDSDNGEFAPLKKKSQQIKQQRKKMRVISDDEDEDMEAEKKKVFESKIPSIFRRPEAQPMIIGMTQLFDSTIGNVSGEVQVKASQDVYGKVNILRYEPSEGLQNSQMLNFDDESQDQSQPESSKLKLEYSQSQKWPLEPEQLPKVVLQYDSDGGDDMPDPTQDQGFAESPGSVPSRFTPEAEEPTSTLSTQMLDSQLGTQKRKRGRLVRKETDFSDEEGEERVVDSAEEEVEEDVADIAENVFDLMKKSSKKTKKAKKPKEPDNFDKSKSEAKGMVHEQAEESEDEYAGIGGASDDDADKDGHDSEMEDMVDDTNAENVDEAAMAAYYAEREKVQDEKDVNKLLKDLQSGLLRKKRGAEFDLDDSDDEDDAEARRRAAKRRQMAKMRKELLKDGNIEKIASNPKRLAFLAAIEDRDRDEEMDFLDRGEEDLFLELGMVSQSEVSQSQQCEGSEEASPAPLGVDEESGEGGKEASREGSKETTPLPVPQSRRPIRSKVSSLVHVREQLSFLVEENESQIDFSDDDDEEESAAIRRERTGCVIDRVAVMRSTSAISENAKMAFQTSTTSTFKVPTLLRRATTSSTISTGSDSQNSNASGGTERSLGQHGDGAGVRRGGKASSSINFHTREHTRSKVVHERENKKKIERKKEGMKRQSVLGILAKGGFS